MQQIKTLDQLIAVLTAMKSKHYDVSNRRWSNGCGYYIYFKCAR
jgi:hypothetical protein